MSTPSQPRPQAEGARPERTGQRESGRARRKAAAEQAARRKQLMWLGGAVAAALVVALVLILVNRPRDTGAPIVLAAPLPESIATSGFMMGDPDAPLSVLEWGDYQCPGCGIFAREVAPRLIEKYVEPGQMNFEFRSFSFLGEESFRAAEAALCAADQDAFWPYHETLYLNQQGENLNAFADERLKQIAADLALDTEAFNSCLESGEKRAAVEQSAADARAQGITSTPSVFVNGVRLEDWRNWDAVTQVIDAELGKS